jgi:hypothetical protein
MVKKIVALEDYITAHDAAQLLSLKHGRPISAKYVRLLAKRKKQPVRAQQKGDRILYHREDIMTSTIKEKAKEERHH